MTINVVKVGADAVIYPFHSQAPYVKYAGHTEPVDPTPAYSHDASVARDSLDQVAKTFPIEWSVTIWLLPREGLGRTNGSTKVDADYDYEAPLENGRYPLKSIQGTIEFSAKRIPPHPAMTRYLVAHEYGHVVEEWLNKQRPGAELHDNVLIKQYAKLRGLEFPNGYGAGLWHWSPGEVFANDFRILVCKVETEFWPHPGIDRPETSYAIRGWWAARLDEQREAEGVGGVKS